MPPYSDIYVISRRRDRETVDLFLDTFLPAREEAADEWELPMYSQNPEIVFHKVDEILEYCFKHTRTEHRVYWRALENRKPEHAMIFFLHDEYAIYGLSTDESDSEFADHCFEKLKKLLGSDVGYLGFEDSVDADSFEEFSQIVDEIKREALISEVFDGT